jgi:hypothetical protein
MKATSNPETLRLMMFFMLSLQDPEGEILVPAFAPSRTGRIEAFFEPYNLGSIAGTRQ